MSQAEIISEIPKLSHEERREIVRCIIEAEEDAETLAVCDRAVLKNFQMLDKIEPEIEESWKQETRRRLAELESGKVQAVPGEVVSSRIRKIVGR
jgi:putative addiction module component (TIGR02574 family)